MLESVDRSRITLAAEIAGKAMDRMVLEMIGVVRARVEKPARSGGKFAFLTISDPSGEAEMMVMPEMLGDVRDQLETGARVSLRVEVRKRDEEIRLSVGRVVPLAQAKLGPPPKSLNIHLAAAAELENLAETMVALSKAPGTEKGDIYVYLPLENGQRVKMRLPERYRVDIEALRMLKGAAGVDQVEAA